MNKMQQSVQQAMNGPPSTPLNLVSTEQIQKYLDENKNLIMAILECQKMGKVAECAQYQAILQKNLMYLAAIADAQPPGSSTPSQLQISTSSVADSQIQASAVPQKQQQPGAKMPFQLNAVRPQDQQNQLLQFQQQQMQGHFSLGGVGGGVANINNGLHMLMHPVPGHANMMDFRGNQPGGLEASPGNDQGNSGMGRDARE